jgi:hypothetical protein
LCKGPGSDDDINEREVDHPYETVRPAYRVGMYLGGSNAFTYNDDSMTYREPERMMVAAYAISGPLAKQRGMLNFR